MTHPASDPALAEFLITEKLVTRPCRSPEHAHECHALLDLAALIADAPNLLLQRLVDTAMKLTGANSAGVSLLEEPKDAPPLFRWVATAGVFAPFLNGTMPRHDSPCGVVVARDQTLLFTEPHRYWRSEPPVEPPVSELLLLPFHLSGKPIGTLWVALHDPEKKFDAEDARILKSLSAMASVGVCALRSTDALQARQDELTRRHHDQTRVMEQLEEARRLEARLIRTVENERAKLARIIEQSPAFICTLRGPDHVFELANECYFDIVGHRSILGKPVREAVPEAEGQGFFELLDRVYQTGETYTGREVPIWLHRSDDIGLERRHLNFVYQAMRGPDGRVMGIFVHGVDVTEMVRAREAIRESEEAFRQLADAMPQIVWAARPDGVLDYYNERWYAYTGMPRGGTGNESWEPVLHSADVPRAHALWTHALKTGENYEAEVRYRRGSDGEYRWHLARAFPARDARGNIVRWYGTSTDVHDYKQLQTRNKELLTEAESAREQAEQASRAKDRFLAVLSHELRTPLSPVVMSVSALEKNPELPPPLREEIAMIRRNVELETRLIDDLLDLSRVINGKLRLHPETLHLHDLLRHTTAVCAADAADRRLHIRLLPNAANDRVKGDPARLQQVFWNLLKNAIKFSHHGGEILVRTAAVDGNIRVEVHDEGAGISAATLPRVFAAFEQGDTRMTREFGGLGLGLAISKAVIDMHGGTITAESEGPGKGATFTVLLPTTTEKAASEPAPSNHAAAASGLRILLAEDHPDTSRVLARLLRMAGYHVATAASVTAALQLAETQSFDILISDIGLPDGTGYDLMEQIKARHDLTGIALSGYGMEDDVRRGQQAGFVEHVVKPVNFDHLESLLRRLTSPKAPPQ